MSSLNPSNSEIEILADYTVRVSIFGPAPEAEVVFELLVIPVQDRIQLIVIE